MSELLVSVIIPVYNVAPYLREAIDSVINQTYRKLEIIIIDDGSTDGSDIICDEYKSDSRVRVIHQENKGLSGARNIGLDIMTGDVVAFLDSDDAFYPNMIEIMMEQMQHTSADIVICGFMWDNNRIAVTESILDTKEALRKLINGSIELAVWNKIYKSSIWDNIRFPDGNYEGTRTTFKLLEKATKVVEMPDCLLFHRTRPGSIVQTLSKTNIIDFFRASKEYESFVIEHQSLVSEKEFHRFFEQRCYQKIIHWSNMCAVDRQMAKRIRKDILRQTTDISYWSFKTKMKLIMLRVSPSLLRIVCRRYSIRKAIKKLSLVLAAPLAEKLHMYTVIVRCFQKKLIL